MKLGENTKLQLNAYLLFFKYKKHYSVTHPTLLHKMYQIPCEYCLITIIYATKRGITFRLKILQLYRAGNCIFQRLNYP